MIYSKRRPLMRNIISIRQTLVFLILAISVVSKCLSSSIPELESQHESFKSVVEDVKQEISTVEQLVSKYEIKLNVARDDLKQAKLRVNNKQTTLTGLESNYFESPSEPLKRSIRQGMHGLDLAMRGEKSKTKRVSRIEGKLIKSQNVSSMLKQEKGRIIAKIALLQKDIKVAKLSTTAPSKAISEAETAELISSLNDVKPAAHIPLEINRAASREEIPESTASLVVTNDVDTNNSALGSAKVLVTEKSEKTPEIAATEEDEKDNVKLKQALKKLSQFRQWR